MQELSRLSHNSAIVGRNMAKKFHGAFFDEDLLYSCTVKYKYDGCADKGTILGVGLKIEIHEIHQNLRNPVSINRPIVSATCLNQ